MPQKKTPAFAGPFLICEDLVIADAVVMAAPPIRTPRNEGLSAQPPTIVVGVVIGTVNPDPNTVPKYLMRGRFEAEKKCDASSPPARFAPKSRTLVGMAERVWMRSFTTRPKIR